MSKVKVQGSEVQSCVSAADFILRSFGAPSGLPCQLSIAIKVVVQVVDRSAVLLDSQVVQVRQKMLKHSRCNLTIRKCRNVPARAFLLAVCSGSKIQLDLRGKRSQQQNKKHTHTQKRKQTRTPL